MNKLYVDDRLRGSWREGPEAKHNAYLEDYAGLILALFQLFLKGEKTAEQALADIATAWETIVFQDPLAQ